MRIRSFSLVLISLAVGALPFLEASALAAPRIVYSQYLDGSHRSGIVAIDPDGSGRRRLSRGRYHFYPRWSPDRTHVAFVHARYGQPMPTNTTGEISRTLKVMRADGTRTTSIAEISGDYDWAPGSRRLVFELDGDLWIASRDGDEPTRLTQTPQHEAHPDWAPGGAEIAFTGTSVSTDPLTPGIGGDIFAIPAGGGEVRRVTTDPGDDFRPRWSPDGTRIAFISTRGHCCDEEIYGSDLFVVGADGTDELRLSDDCTWKQSQDWSPDGSAMVYESHPDDDACPAPTRYPPLVLVDASAATAIDLLPSGRLGGEHPSFSPGGRWIVFSSPGREATTDLFRVRVRDLQVRRVVANTKTHEVEADW
ncbi:MAG TPA: hypothetical protein VJ927_03885 [Actinomycetota bacterium]|nr:hypothetical protein [Actinomycetota bacterium]